MEKITPAFRESLFDPILSDAVMEITDLSIDSILDESNIVKNIPIVSLLVGFARTAQNIHDRNLLKQTIKFINTFNSNEIDKEKLEIHKQKLYSSTKFAEKELERVLVILNSTIDLKKSEILANCYAAYIEERLTWEEFCEYADVTSRLFITDINVLLSIYHREIRDTTQCKSYQVDRLVGLGLISITTKSMRISSHNRSNTEHYVQTSTLGDKYCKIALGSN